MKRLLLLSLCLVLAGAVTASAQPLIGGHDETSEPMPVNWTVAPPTPTPSMIGPPGIIQPHLLLNEFVVTPTAGEFVEICNPTGLPVDLSNTYLSDDWYSSGGALPPTGCYCFLPQAGYAVGTTSDFIVKFPNGVIIQPWQTYVIAFSATGFFTTYGILPDFEIFGDDPNVPDMINVGNNSVGTSGLTNSAEIIALFHWDGISDNVCDVDYVCWGTVTTYFVDKTGTAVDGPDADAIATAFLPDTPQLAQLPLAAPGFGFSGQRVECAEFQEMPGPGNGCVPGATPTRNSTWGQLKTLYR